jgi:hypothetical protein
VTPTALRLALAQINLCVGDIEGNTAQGARCEHEKTCKWSGLLIDLLR